MELLEAVSLGRRNELLREYLASERNLFSNGYAQRIGAVILGNCGARSFELAD